MNTKIVTVTTSDTVCDTGGAVAVFTCPYCNARFEFEEDCEDVVIHAPDDMGFLPQGKKNQIAWLISYSLCLLMLGGILYKFVIGPLM